MSNKTKKSNKNSKNTGSASDGIQLVLEDIVCILGIAVSVLLPLYLKDGYHGVGDCKYELYRILMIVGTVILLVLSLAGLWQKRDFVAEAVRNRISKGIPLSDLLKNPGFWTLLFLIFSFIAAIIGGSFTKCLIGYTGWYMGILSLVSFAVLYYYFAQAGRLYKTVLATLLGTSFLTYIFGILHRLMIDVLGTYAIGTEREIADYYKNMFLSTLGQASWYSSFVCTIAPAGFAVFMFAKKRYLRIISGIFSFAAAMTMVTQNSDSAYIAMLGFFFVFFWFAAESAEGFRHFWELLVLFVAAARCMFSLFIIHPNPILQLDALSQFMVCSPWMWGVLFFTVLMLLLSVFMEKKQKYPIRFMRLLRVVLLILIISALLAAVLLLYLGAKGRLPDSVLVITQKIPYMTWSDNWGNGRGKTWSFSFRMYQDMDIWHKLFGVGPDGYAYYAYELYEERLQAMWGDQTLTNAHNEWMNALINYGLVGVTCYIGIFLSSVRSFAQQVKEEPILIGFIACIISYMCHNFFCYQTVCCTPFIFMIMGMGTWLVNSRQHLAAD